MIKGSNDTKALICNTPSLTTLVSKTKWQLFFWKASLSVLPIRHLMCRSRDDCCVNQQLCHFLYPWTSTQICHIILTENLDFINVLSRFLSFYHLKSPQSHSSPSSGLSQLLGWLCFSHAIPTDQWYVSPPSHTLFIHSWTAHVLSSWGAQTH